MPPRLGHVAFVRYQHDPADPNSLLSNFVSSITQDAEGHLWVGTWEGLGTLDLTRNVSPDSLPVPGIRRHSATI